MTARTSKGQLHLAQDRNQKPERNQNPYTDYNAGIQDMFGQAMDQALGVQKASLNAVVKMQNDVIEMQKHAFEHEPAIGNIFEAASQAYATCLNIQLSWLNMMVSWAKQGAETWYQLAGVGASLAGIPAPQPQPAMAEQDEEEEVISYTAA
jgi:hypothetical protein